MWNYVDGFTFKKYICSSSGSSGLSSTCIQQGEKSHAFKSWAEPTAM